MTFDHIESLAVAMNCAACAEPLPDREVETLAGEQEGLFE